MISKELTQSEHNSEVAYHTEVDSTSNLPSHDCGAIRIEIALKDARHQANYQALVDRYCQA